MKKNSGQALVEFVVILPVLLLIILSAIDLGNIIYKKYHLESDLDVIVDLYEQKKEFEINDIVTKNGYHISYNTNTTTTTITLQKQVNITTPGLNIALKNPYQIKVDRVIYHE